MSTSPVCSVSPPGPILNSSPISSSPSTDLRATSSPESSSLHRQQVMSEALEEHVLPVAVDVPNDPVPNITDVAVESSTNELALPDPGPRSHPMQTRAKSCSFKPKMWGAFLASSSPEIEPCSITEALNSKCWRVAMDSEMDALVRNQTWKLVPPPPNVNLVGNKWVFKVKRKSDGSFDRCKARLVAKGFNQVPGIDFHETFSPVAKAPTIRIVFAVAVSRGWPIHQLDVNNAFLKGRLEEIVYMAQPEGYVSKTLPNHVCKLEKAIYGLRQTPRAWYDRFRSTLIGWGFRS